MIVTPDRWRQIEALYHAARERGPAAFEGADPELRSEVERLLAQDATGRILDRPPADLLRDLTVTQEPPGPPGFAGQTVSHYDIVSEIGAGGMGVVYKANDTRLGRLVALKFLPPHLSHNHDLKKQLRDEARAASALDHPNIVVIHDIDETPGGDVFIAMAFHEGVTLREKIRAGLPVKESLQIARQIASGLAKAHEHGIFHRDIKPSNVIVANDGIARIIDFGLAKSSDVTATVDGSTKGTPLYMSPEQAAGKATDPRTDLWSLGAVLYEMLAGKPPFAGETQVQVLHAIVYADPPALNFPAGIARIVTRALEKDLAKRYQSAAEMVADLSAALAALESPPVVRKGVRAVYAIPAAAALLVAAGALFWFYQRTENRRWAREHAVPEIAKLADQKKPVAAYRLLQQAEKYLPGDPQIEQLIGSLSHVVSVQSTPPGATVEIKDYLSPDDAWFPLGVTPLPSVRIPSGYLRWRVSKAGVGEFLGAPEVEEMLGYFKEFNFALDAGAKAPEGMAAVPATKYFAVVWSLGDVAADLPPYFIDRYEVTNRQYQEFVDQGGYREHDYWKEKFLREGRELSWEQAIDLMRDSTGRPGPSTWAAGHYPEGQADYPVGGVSWYEASAYAEFAGKSLPVLAQWYLAAPSPVAKYIMPLSNFSSAVAPVGKYQGLGPWGTYDMAGNVVEWCRNESGGGNRFVLGGGFDTATNEYFEPGGLPPFHRGANSGFRCVRNTAVLPAEAVSERRQAIRALANAKPATDAVFQIYKAMYSYDRTPLNAKLETVAQDSADWRKEKVTFDAAYGKERVTAYLFLPAHVKPPYQTVVFFPSARALFIPSSETLTDMKFIDYVIQSGRAVVYPVYKGMYERTAPPPGTDFAAARDTLIQNSKDLGRSLDYLETRPEFDHNRIAFMGESMGAALGVNLVGVEERFRSAIFLDGGFYIEKPLPGTDQVDFAPHIKASALLISGKFDWIFLGKDTLLRMLGAPAADKKAVIFNTAHDVSEQRADLVREVLAWLDQSLGKVN